MTLFAASLVVGFAAPADAMRPCVKIYFPEPMSDPTICLINI